MQPHVRHVVLLRFTDPADAPETAGRLEALRGKVPGLLTLDVGVDVVRTEASWDLALVTTHTSLEALDDYAQHPAHQDFLAWVRPRLRDRAVVDAPVAG